MHPVDGLFRKNDASVLYRIDRVYRNSSTVFREKRLNVSYVIARGITVQPCFKHKHEGSPGEGPPTDVGQGTESDWVMDDSKGENDLG